MYTLIYPNCVCPYTQEYTTVQGNEHFLSKTRVHLQAADRPHAVTAGASID